LPCAKYYTKIISSLEVW